MLPGAIEVSEGSKYTFISYRSETQLEKKYSKDAIVLGLVAVGLLVFGLVFVAVGGGAAFLNV